MSKKRVKDFLIKSVEFYLNTVTDQINSKITTLLETHKNSEKLLSMKLIEQIEIFIINLDEIYNMILFLYKQNDLKIELGRVAHVFHSFRQKSEHFETFRLKMTERYRNYLELLLVIYALSLVSHCPDNAKTLVNNIDKSLRKSITLHKNAFQKQVNRNFEELRLGTLLQFDNFFANQVLKNFTSTNTTGLFVAKIQSFVAEMNLKSCHSVILKLDRSINPSAGVIKTLVPDKIKDPCPNNVEFAIKKQIPNIKLDQLDLLRKQSSKNLIIDKELNKTNKKVKTETGAARRQLPSNQKFISILNQNKHITKKFTNINLTPSKVPKAHGRTELKNKHVHNVPPRIKSRNNTNAHDNSQLYMQNNLINFRKLNRSDFYQPFYKRVKNHKIKLCNYREVLEKRKKEKKLFPNSRTSKNSVLSEDEIFTKTLLNKHNLLAKDLNDSRLNNRAEMKLYFNSAQNSPRKCNSQQVVKYFNIVQGKPYKVKKRSKTADPNTHKKAAHNETCLHTGESDKSSLDPDKEIFRKTILEMYDKENPFDYEKEDLYPDVLDRQHSCIF